jgi:hypothetical protein
MKTVLPFSGGVDSTYALWKLLSETQDEVTAVFVDISNISPADITRYDLRSFSGSDRTTSDIAAQWLQANVRSFTYIVQPFDAQYAPRGIENVNSPPTYVTRFAVPRINTGEFDRLVCTNEKENDGFANGGTIETRRPGSIAAREIFVANATRGSIEFPLIDSNYTQANALAEMPSELLSIVDHCAVGDTSFKCQKKIWFQNLLNEGKTPAQAWGIYYATCTQVAGKWFSMKFWLGGAQPSTKNLWDMPQWPSSYTVP